MPDPVCHLLEVELHYPLAGHQQPGGESLFSMQARMLPGAAMTQVGSNQSSSARQRVRKGSLPDRGEPASQSGSDAKVIPHRVIEIGAVVGTLVGQLRVGQPEDLA